MPIDRNKNGASAPKLGGTVHEELNKARSVGLAVALGAALGAAGGAATGHIGVWVGAGIAAYIALTLAHDIWKPKANDQRQTTND